jgi:hypothetical protein
MPLMRSASVSLVLMGSTEYARRAVTGDVVRAAPRIAPPADQPPRRRTIMRGGFGQLGDSLTEADLAPA